VVYVTNRPYVHVGLAALEFLFCHDGIPMRYAQLSCGSKGPAKLSGATRRQDPTTHTTTDSRQWSPRPESNR
jgi:hypothetical protein